jgi:SAM-dependent methyltransferase
MKIRSVVKGALTFVPGAQRFLPKPNAGNNPSTAYYYGVWLKHLSYLFDNGICGVPESIAELGPGDALGLGITALLCGANRFYGLDIFAHTNPAHNLQVLDELADLLKRRAPRPGKGWPDFDHLLDSKLFPSHILTDQRLSASLVPQRIESIRDILRTQKEQAESITLAYRVPWSDTNVIERDTIDLIISHAVLEHVVDVEKTYQAMYMWLKPGGVMSHQIDFRSHNLTSEWNGHRAIPDWLWSIMVGKRPYLINREPWSVHRRVIMDCGFEIVSAMQQYRHDGMSRSRLSDRWRNISEDDLTCSEAFVQARKPASSPSAIVHG